MELRGWVTISYFNPRSPCGERPEIECIYEDNIDISIHAPRVGSDTMTPITNPCSTISIHAPRVGSDIQPT